MMAWYVIVALLGLARATNTFNVTRRTWCVRVLSVRTSISSNGGQGLRHP